MDGTTGKQKSLGYHQTGRHIVLWKMQCHATFDGVTNLFHLGDVATF
jgi:hypothetical protein